MKFCVVIPIHNEAEYIAGVVAAVREYGMDIIVVDDGSTDESARLAGEAGARVLRRPARSGKGATLRHGFAHALAENYDGVITMDGDGQHLAQDLPAFLEAARACPVGIISGSRMRDVRAMPLVRLWTNRVMSVLISHLCRQRIPDTQCGFRYIHCDILRKVSLESSEFQIETEVLVQASRAGYPISSVDISTIYAGEHSKINPLRDTLNFLRYYLREIFRRNKQKEKA
ncbi:MAG: glycosyltransferase family 2 protein [Candidatus Omnitrophota bacterium]